MSPFPAAFRRSPVVLPGVAAQTEVRDGWTVVTRYAGTGPGPWLVDLSHRRRWDFQDGDVGAKAPMGLPVPPMPGLVERRGDLVISRMNRTQVSIWHLGAGHPPATPEERSYTDTADGHCSLAFVGPGTHAALEHLTPLDLFEPGRARPFLTQGPVLHVPCQVVTFTEDLVVMTFSRGYGQSFADAALHSAAPAGLTPGGEDTFNAKYDQLGGDPSP